MIVLDPDRRAAVRTLGFIGHRVREPDVHVAIAVPVLGAILEVLDEHVAQRPKRAIGEAVVIPLNVGVVEPHTAQLVRRIARRHRDAAHFIGDLMVGVSRTPRDPGAVGASHRGVEGAHKAAGGLLDLGFTVDAAHVFVRLAVRDENELAVAEVAGEIEH